MVATSRGGPPEFVRDGEDGLLVDPFDTAAVAEVLGRILSDHDLCRTIAVAGRARVEAFAWPLIAEEYRAVYAAVGDGRPDRFGVMTSPQRCGWVWTWCRSTRSRHRASLRRPLRDPGVHAP